MQGFKIQIIRCNFSLHWIGRGSEVILFIIFFIFSLFGAISTEHSLSELMLIGSTPIFSTFYVVQLTLSPDELCSFDYPPCIKEPTFFGLGTLPVSLGPGKDLRSKRACNSPIVFEKVGLTRNLRKQSNSGQEAITKIIDYDHHQERNIDNCPPPEDWKYLTNWYNWMKRTVRLKIVNKDSE